MHRLGWIAVGVLVAGLLGQKRPRDIAPKDSTLPPPKYVQFDFDGDPERMLAEFLNGSKPGDRLQNLFKNEWQKLLDQPPDGLQKLLEQQGQGNPFLKELVDKFLENNPNLPEGNPGAMKEMLKRFGDQIQNNKGLGEALRKGLNGKINLDDLPPFKDAPPLVPPERVEGFDPPKLPELDMGDLTMEDRFGQWLNDWLKDESVQESIADFLRDAPALQNALGDLARSLQGGLGDTDWLSKMPNLGGKLPMDFKLPSVPFRLGDMPKFPNIAMPKLPNMKLPLPKFAGNWSMPRLPGFGGRPNMPAMPNASTTQGWVYGVVALLVLGVCWYFARNLNWKSRGLPGTAAWLATLPATITTRSELREAFERLALMTLGDKARSWNHVQAGRSLGETVAQAGPANALAQLYEMARYTPGEERLSTGDQARVRDCLAVLAGGAA